MELIVSSARVLMDTNKQNDHTETVMVLSNSRIVKP
jgi:hypothetical protein